MTLKATQKDTQPYLEHPEQAQLKSQSVGINRKLPEITWSSFAETILCVNAYPNGITLSVHKGQREASESAPAQRYLPFHFMPRSRETRDYLVPPGRYFLYKKNFADALMSHLSTLHHKGLLGNTVCYFGTTTDPFLGLHRKFDVTMAVLEILEQFRPSRFVVQTRSPMVISGLPLLKRIEDRAVVGIPIETPLEKAIQRYTPGQPRIAERLIAASGLRKQGLKVNLIAAPLLPYGDMQQHAWDFAEILDRYADYITLGCLATGTSSDEAQLKNLPVAERLVQDQQFQWLRPHCYQALLSAVRAIAPEKLRLPVEQPAKPAQLDMFAA